MDEDEGTRVDGRKTLGNGGGDVRRLIEATLAVGCALFAARWLLIASGEAMPRELDLPSERISQLLVGYFALLLLLGLVSGGWGVRRWLLTLGLLALGFALAVDPGLAPLAGAGIAALRGGEWTMRSAVGASIAAAVPVAFAMSSGHADRSALMIPSRAQLALRAQGALCGILLLAPSAMIGFGVFVEAQGHAAVRQDLAMLVASLEGAVGSPWVLETLLHRAPLALAVIVSTASLFITLGRGVPRERTTA